MLGFFVSRNKWVRRVHFSIQMEDEVSVCAFCRACGVCVCIHKPYIQFNATEHKYLCNIFAVAEVPG